MDDEEVVRNITELKPDGSGILDLRGPATHECTCGCSLWNIKASFEDDEISFYYLDMECALCGNLATAPYPGWREDWEREKGYKYPLDGDLRLDSGDDNDSCCDN